MTGQEGDSGSEDILDKMSDLFAEIDDLCEGVDHDLLDIKDALISKRGRSGGSAPTDSGETRSEELRAARPTGPQRLSFKRRPFRSAPRRTPPSFISDGDSQDEPAPGEGGPEAPEETKAESQRSDPEPTSRRTIAMTPEELAAFELELEEPEESPDFDLEEEPGESPDFDLEEEPEKSPDLDLEEEPEEHLALDLEEKPEAQSVDDLEDDDELVEPGAVTPAEPTGPEFEAGGTVAVTREELDRKPFTEVEAGEQLAPGDIESALLAAPEVGAAVGAATQLMGAAATPTVDVFETLPPKTGTEEKTDSEVSGPTEESTGAPQTPPDSDGSEPILEISPKRASPKRLDKAMAELMTQMPVATSPVTEDQQPPGEDSARPAVIDAEMIALLQKSKKPEKKTSDKPTRPPRLALTVHPEALEEAFTSLLGVEGAEVACVFTFEEKLTLRHVQGIEPDDLSKLRPLFESTVEQEASQLVLDSFKERGFEEAIGFFRSGVSVPVLAQGQFVGLLFAGSSKPGTLAYGATKKLELLAESLGTRFERAAPEERNTGSLVKAVRLPEVNPVKFLVGGGLLLGLAVIWTLAGTYHGATTRSPRPTPTQSEKIIRVETASPEVLAITLLREIKFRRWPEIYRMLSPQLQQAGTEEELTKLLAGWVEDAAHRWDLDSRRPMVLKTGDNYVTVSIEPGPEAEGKKPWSWIFVKEDSGWKLFEMKGPVSLSPKV